MDEARIAAERICAMTAASSESGLPAYPVSVGVIAVTEPATPVDGLLSGVDQARYKAKANGRNRVELNHAGQADTVPSFS